MSETIYLVGSEDVRSAGSRIAGAASEIRQAAGCFDESVTRLERILAEHADRIEAALEDDHE